MITKDSSDALGNHKLFNFILKIDFHSPIADHLLWANYFPVKISLWTSKAQIASK